MRKAWIVALCASLLGACQGQERTCREAQSDAQRAWQELTILAYESALLARREAQKNEDLLSSSLAAKLDWSRLEELGDLERRCLDLSREIAKSGRTPPDNDCVSGEAITATGETISKLVTSEVHQEASGEYEEMSGARDGYLKALSAAQERVGFTLREEICGARGNSKLCGAAWQQCVPAFEETVTRAEALRTAAKAYLDSFPTIEEIKGERATVHQRLQKLQNAIERSRKAAEIKGGDLRLANDAVEAVEEAGFNDNRSLKAAISFSDEVRSLCKL